MGPIRMRASPSGKAVAFQATIRGSESRLPLQTDQGVCLRPGRNRHPDLFSIHPASAPNVVKSGRTLTGPVAQWLERAA